jgi:hypothetical protein
VTDWRIGTGDSKSRLRALAWRAAGAVRRRVSIDGRALAAFRIALGALLLADLALRSRNLVAFYTDRGVLPREALFADYGQVYSLHALWGEAWIQAVVFLIAGVFALALLVGYRTRLAAVVSWLLLVSLHVRNPMVLNGGDSLFRMLLFWGMFLPLGTCWSVDAARREGKRDPDRSTERSTVASVATAALLLQMVLLYVTNAIHKSRGEQWLNGEAVVYVFSLDQFTVLLGNVLAPYYGLLRVFTYAWITLVILAPLMLLSAGKVRVLLATLLAGMHLGMLVTMQIGLFPLVVVAGLLPFYPAWVWDRVADLAERFGVAARARRLGTGLARRLYLRPHVSSDGGTDETGERSPADTASRIVAQGVPLFFLALIVFSNVQAAGLAEVPETGQEILETTETDQHWRMFAPDPLGTDGWYVVPGELEDGSTVDVRNGGAVNWDRPPNIDATYPTARWRKYLRNVWSAANKNHESYYAHYLCGRWNRTHETDVSSVKLYYMAQPSQPYNATEPVSRRFLREHDCSGPLTQ